MSISKDTPQQGGSAYEPPVVTDYGDLVELTAGNTNGQFTDRSFPAHTPKQDLTFSG